MPKPVEEPTIENILNRETGELPFGYFHPASEGNLTWHCDRDQSGKIVGVFCMNKVAEEEKEKKVSILDSMEQALYFRQTLIDDGWQKIKPPAITIKRDDGTETPLNRKERRHLNRHLAKMSKNNPYDK